MMKKMWIKALLVLAILSSCNEERHKDAGSAAFKKERKNRSFRKISQGEITAQAFKVGRELRPVLDSLNTLGKLDSTQQWEGFKISVIDSSRFSKADSISQQLYDAYLYNLENKLPMEDNVQALNDDRYIYAYPLQDSLSSSFKLVEVFLAKKNIILSM
ncbi:hypothetical protein [Aureibacter tunicatorum]|uniref:Uncharacterized protein n=1 Tax=Aureibacter tunicatorum TaxID=866807 RepID=A0AAE4BR16_9BACT|nr:hypothetical protein [Aureibacter tunicatorum]MDR6237310.1 hypothetical protein [Aureibacter tunicatorum]BDD06301.1 hypothetical protein AUTU_37840 [Aureibacter tunicatorum]